jgi:hypothetical protein
MTLTRTYSKALSRRCLLSGASAVAFLGTNVTSGWAAKVSQSAVSYQASPKGEQHCSNCKQFQPPNTCRMVDGKISGQGWCMLWMKP